MSEFFCVALSFHFSIIKFSQFLSVHPILYTLIFISINLHLNSLLKTSIQTQKINNGSLENFHRCWWRSLRGEDYHEVLLTCYAFFHMNTC